MLQDVKVLVMKMKKEFKNKSIFTSPEVLHYISNAIYENLYKNDKPINYTFWNLAFHNTYSELNLNNKKTKKNIKNKENVSNFIINSVNVSTTLFFRRLFSMVYELEDGNDIEDADFFIGSMVAWMLDPARSYFTSKQRKKAI